MTLALLTLILIGYVKLTGKTIPGIEKRLRKVKNSKNANISELTENEIKSISISKLDNTTFKGVSKIKNYNSCYPKTQLFTSSGIKI